MTKQLILKSILVLALCLSVTGIAFAAPALDPAPGLHNGVLDSLTVTNEVGIGSGEVHTIWNNTQYNYNVYWTQPQLHLVQGNYSADVFGLCIDSVHFVNTNTPYNTYVVSNYADPVQTIESADAWNKLTYMWSKATVTSPEDRTALQLATWKGCANDWDISRNNYWTSADGAGVQFWLNDNPSVITQTNFYLGLANNNYDGNEVAGYRVISNGNDQSFAAAVPEPGTIMAALSILAPVGFVFRRKKTC